MTTPGKKVLRVLRIPFEWLGIGLGALIFALLSRRGMLRFCDALAAAAYRLDARGRRLALANLRIVRGTFAGTLGQHYAWGVGNPTPSETKIIRRSYRNMARTVGFAFWSCLRPRARARACGKMSPAGKALLSANKPVVTVSGHIGCWEILSQLAFLEGHRMMSVAKDIGTRSMTRLLMETRRAIGQEIIPADGAFRPLLKGLKSGKSLGLLVDQAVDPKDGGLWVRFFGIPHPVSVAPAFFAAKCKAPIVVGWSRPLKDGRWFCEIISTYTPEEASDIWGVTQKCLKDLERVIRRHPSCWVLNYNCFRKTPTAEERTQLEAREAAAS